MRTEQVTLTNMCMVYDDDGNVLVQDKVDNDWGGLTFPGGHIEKGESFVDSVIREVYEESGLKIENPRICGIVIWLSSIIIRNSSPKYSINVCGVAPGASPAIWRE